MDLNIIIENKMRQRIEEYIEKYSTNEKRITWSDIADKIGCTRQNLEKICRGNNPSLSSLIKFSEVLNVKILDLFTYKVEK